MQFRTRIKVCGITSPADAKAAAAAGVDALGFVFHPASPRNITIAQAREIVEVLPAFVSSVALVMDAQPKFVRSMIEELRPDLLQFHGRETAEYCEQFAMPYIKAFSVDTFCEQPDVLEKYTHARGYLVDSHAVGKQGGTGQTFDWSRIPPALGQRLILAGGLNANNVEQAIAIMQPAAVDVSSGVESMPGIKDPARIRAFVENVRRADANSSDAG